MARNFDAGAEVSTGGSDFKNPEVGSHEAILSGILHCGSYCDLFGKDLKPAANFVLAEFILMGDEDLQDDGSRMRAYKAFPLKGGTKAFMTNFLDAIDPKEATSGWTDCIGLACTVDMVGSKDKNEDGTPTYVNFGGVSGCPDKLAKLIYAQVKEEALEPTGHITYEAITGEHLKRIPPFLVRQFFINEGRGENKSFDDGHLPALVAELRSEDKDWAKVAEKDDKGSKPAQSNGNTAPQGSTSVPANIQAPEGLTDQEEY